MMNEKRFTVNELVKFNYSEIGEYVDENHTDRPLRNDEVVDLLNELSEENEKLRNIHLSIDLTYSYGYGRYLADVRVIDNE